MYDIRDFIESVTRIVGTHQLEARGAYRRWMIQDDAHSRDMGLNPYGCADAANILYTIGRFPRDAQERADWVRVLQGMQDPLTGFFRESTHHEIHTTAHCIAALELFDVLPLYRLKGLDVYKRLESMEAFLEQLDWKENPWGASHQGAGLYASLVLAGEVSFEWEEHYFKWLYENTDRKTGFLRKGCITHRSNEHDIFPHLAGTFHYCFNQQYARKPLAYPEAMVDSCIEIFDSQCFPLGNSVGFIEIDWVYCLTRSLRQSGHRHEDAMGVLIAFCDRYVPYLLELDPVTHERLNDLHSLFGMTCCLAELQSVLPGYIKTSRPLRLVLDRRPFI